MSAGCIGRLIRRVRRARLDNAGLAAVEFGMALPVFLLFVFGTIEFGRILWSKHALDYAAEQSTRYALANPDATTGEIQTYAEGQLMTVDRSAVTVTVVQENLNGIDYLSVTMAYPFQAILPFLPLGSFSLTGVSRIPLDT
jgi:Flp pilus assembly protein TadG